MTAAIRQWLANYPETKLVLIGFSGGGVLATLILPELPQAQALVTVAANLDVSAWSEIHGYLPLSDSLNPMDQPKLRPNVRQLHLAGSDDNNVPPALIKAFADKQDGARYVEYHQQHHCCWETIWPEPLRFID